MRLQNTRSTIDFNNPNRYRTRRILNKIRDFVWSVLMLALVIVMGFVAIKYSLPWIQTLWATVK